MSTFKLDIGDRSRNSGRFIGRVRRELAKTFTIEVAKGNITKEGLAAKLEVEWSTIQRKLNGEEVMSWRDVADIAWAMGCEVVLEVKPKPEEGKL
jgi:hypothetical protein